MTPKERLNKIKLKPVKGEPNLSYSEIYYRLETIYNNQDKILTSIKLLADLITNQPTDNPTTK